MAAFLELALQIERLQPRSEFCLTICGRIRLVHAFVFGDLLRLREGLGVKRGDHHRGRAVEDHTTSSVLGNFEFDHETESSKERKRELRGEKWRTEMIMTLSLLHKNSAHIIMISLVPHSA